MDHQNAETPLPLAPRLKPPTMKLSEAEPVEERLAPETPSGEKGTPASELTKIAEQADDLNAIKKAVDDAASVGGGLTLSYLFVLFYLRSARCSTADLFLENPVKLPFLNIVCRCSPSSSSPRPCSQSCTLTHLYISPC